MDALGIGICGPRSIRERSLGGVFVVLAAGKEEVGGRLVDQVWVESETELVAAILIGSSHQRGKQSRLMARVLVSVV